RPLRICRRAWKIAAREPNATSHRVAADRVVMRRIRLDRLDQLVHRPNSVVPIAEVVTVTDDAGTDPPEEGLLPVSLSDLPHAHVEVPTSRQLTPRKPHGREVVECAAQLVRRIRRGSERDTAVEILESDRVARVSPRG